ncbi:MAG: ABC transporter permease [Gammaproteobacteria bacterium]
MNSSIQIIPVANLALAFIPVLVVAAILYKWSLGSGFLLYASARMVIQLLLVGYVLTYIFAVNHAALVIAVLAIMLVIASSIALRPLKIRHRLLYAKALAAITVGGGLTLLLITQGVLSLNPWFSPRYLVPLGGMIFANAMNTVSLAAERFEAEIGNAVHYNEARRTALRASLIPLINSLLAVGLVSFPGMMTGQILSGESPLLAVRYQIMVMCMIFGSAGISAACFLVLLRPDDENPGAEGI